VIRAGVRRRPKARRPPRAALSSLASFKRILRMAPNGPALEQSPGALRYPSGSRIKTEGMMVLGDRTAWLGM
jgi:hypothetical protein